MKNKTRLNLILTGWIYPVLVAVILATSFKSAVADWNVVPTGSMNPTILEGDRIFVNKLAYDLKIPYTTCHLTRWGDPQRGQIVVFFSPTDNTRLVKRVVGVPGDILEMRDNQLMINGERVRYDLSEPSGTAGQGRYRYIEHLPGADHPVVVMPRRPAPRSFGPVRVPEGKYFMMGDNRDNSADSRFFGFVDRDRVVGRARSIVISLNILDQYQPRWERFFTALN